MMSLSTLQQRNLSLQRLQHLVHELMQICGLGKSKVSLLHLNLNDILQKALDLATIAANPNSFRVVMRLSHVSNKFYMIKSVPSEWARIHLRTNLDVTLRVEEKTWQADFIHTHHGGALTEDVSQDDLFDTSEYADIQDFGWIFSTDKVEHTYFKIFKEIVQNKISPTTTS
ncbi:hypothetical protein HAX54_009059 [Datura stramonium]|uniref:Uncharacterized protein n=1 Tax=Datura stramonium TaxID=4076 RepID=A0ABS8TGX2_DATST|nr:hypothetical protein [Datura stramonium]